MKIYLIGYMASGKTKLGCRLAGLTGFSFLDLDELFEMRYRLSVFDFFEKYGEEAFRRIEQRLMLETEQLDRTVIATGGGTPCFPGNMDFIRQHGISIYIRMTIPDLAERLKQVRKKRPLLKDVPQGGMESFIEKQFAERESFYLRADYIVDGPDITAEEILKLPRIAAMLNPS